MSTQTKWEGTRIDSIGAFKQFGKPRYHVRYVTLKLDNKVILQGKKRISEQYCKLLGERNIYITDYLLRLNVWFTKKGPDYVVLMHGYKTKTYSTNKGRHEKRTDLTFTKIPGGWIVTGKFKYGSEYSLLDKPIDFSIRVSSELFSPTTSIQTELALQMDKGC